MKNAKDTLGLSQAKMISAGQEYIAMSVVFRLTKARMHEVEANFETAVNEYRDEIRKADFS